VAGYTTADIRNIALVGHAASGKTTLAEALLHAAGAVNTPGSVDKGTTAADFDPQEQRHRHSLNPAFLHFDHQGRHVNLIDTPGYPDFMGQALSVLPAVETVAVVVDAHAGIERTTRQMMNWARSRRLCRMIVVNKIDGGDVDLARLCGRLRDAFGKECLAINLPADGGNKVVDVFFNPKGESDFLSVSDAHTAIVDQVVEVDEALMEKYLEKGSVSPEALHDAFETALREGHLVPICFVSAQTGTGVPELLEVFDRLMPNPTEGNPPPFLRGEGAEAKEVHAEPDPQQHVIAHVVKVNFDAFVGKQGIFRIHQGTIGKDTKLFAGEGRKAFKVGHLFKVQGKDTIETDRGIPGDICAVTKVDDVHFDAVLHDSHDEDQWRLRPVELPQPMYGLAVTARTRGDEQKVADALSKMAEEDPCFVVERSSANNETVMRGLGELHLRIALEKMAGRFNVEVDTHPPSVPYRETITRSAEGHHRHKKQTGGAGQFGEVFLRVEPLARGAGFEFVDAVVGGVIPNQFIPAVEKGVRQVLERGAIAGHPLHDVKVTVYDGKYHNVDSNEVSFSTAGRKAFIDAVKQARPIVLEPIANIEVTVPPASIGDITGDLSSRRGRISTTDTAEDGSVTVVGQVPLAELTDYQSRLKSMTGGEGSYAVELSGYEPVPANIQQHLTSQYKGEAEED
jgi:elongation factor G